jgi:folylpolyglutamate synthase/dihydropteroate synthase
MKKAHQENIPRHSSMEKLNPTMLPAFPLDLTMLRGLKECQWPGRAQIIDQHPITYFVDGAHTPESMVVCRYWFEQSQYR